MIGCGFCGARSIGDCCEKGRAWRRVVTIVLRQPSEYVALAARGVPSGHNECYEQHEPALWARLQRRYATKHGARA